MSSGATEQYRKRLYEIRAAEDLSVQEKLERILAMGVEYLEVDNGHVKRIDQASGIHEVIASVSDGDVDIEIGDFHEHATTFCRHTIEQDSPLAITHAGEEGWQDDPAYREHGLECYLGATVTVQGTPHGTLCFVSDCAHTAEFAPTEQAFVELAAGVVGGELASQQYERELTTRNQLIDVLHRILRHNLRNDINTVSGYAELLATRLDGEAQAHAEEILAHASRLAQLSEKARVLETIAREAPPRRSRDLCEDISSTVESLRDEHPAAELSVTGPETARVMAIGHIQTALYELGENAIEHGGDSPRVEFVVERADDPADMVTVEVADDGPGLRDHGRRVLRGESETALKHGSGVGLWVVYWVVRQSGGTVTVDAEDGTTVRLHLHPAPDHGS